MASVPVVEGEAGMMKVFQWSNSCFSERDATESVPYTDFFVVAGLCASPFVDENNEIIQSFNHQAGINAETARPIVSGNPNNAFML